MTKRKIYTICVCIIIGFSLLSAALFFTIDHFTTKSKIHSYLDENYSRLEITQDGVYGNIITGDYKVYLAGETSGSEKNYAAQLSLIKMLNADEGVNEILAELPHSVCMLLNDYISGGETSLDAVFAMMSANDSRNNTAYRQFFAELKNFNEALPQNKKLHISGLDLEFSDSSVKNAIRILQNMTAQVETVPQSIAENWQKLNEIDLEATYSNQMLAQVFDALTADLDTEKGALLTALKTDITDYVSIVKSVAETVRLDMSDYSAAQKTQLRENLMYAVFQNVYSAYSKSKFFGQFDAEHVNLARKNHTDISNPLAKQINESANLGGAVCSIRFSYKDSQYLDFKKDKVKNIKQTMYEAEFNRFPQAESGLTLFKIDGKNSIFTRQQIIVNGYGRSTADYFQYVLLIDKSAACEKPSQAN